MQVELQTGRMRKRLDIQVLDPAAPVNSFNEVPQNPDKTWKTIGRRWVQLEPMSGRELGQANQVRADISHKATLYFFQGLLPMMRFAEVKNGILIRCFNIIYVLNVSERNRTHLCECKEEVPKLT